MRALLYCPTTELSDAIHYIPIELILFLAFRAASNMQVKNYPKEFAVFSGFNVEEFVSKGYLQRINFLTERFVRKKLVFRVRLRKGDRSKRMLISLDDAEELPSNYGGLTKKKKSA
jgi:hypothetical protein